MFERIPANISKYFLEWEHYLTIFWVPLILSIFFCALAVQAVYKKMPFLAVLYTLLTLCCMSYLGFRADFFNLKF